MTIEDDSDSQTFRAAMRDVRRLQERRAKPAIPKPAAQARFTRADQREVLRESLLPPADPAALATGDELNFRRPHIPEAVLLRLRRGEFAVDADIDLHGLSGREAKQTLREFIGAALNQRMSCVRIIHGKGKRSGPRGPVLKNIVNQWLQRIDSVVAFGSARGVDGGCGAVYVLLKSRR